MPTKAPVAAPVSWWYEGFVEVGGRFYLNDPDTKKLGRFFRYEDWSPGPFGNFYYGAHRTGADPFDLTAWGYDMGWDDQAYQLYLSQPGTYYVTFGWDETPHNYAFDAKTTFGPIGGNVLSTPCYPTGGGNVCGGGAPTANTADFVNANSNIFDLGFRRDTASAAARWTPDDNWDITADYSHLDRHGTQPLSAVTFTNGTRTSVQLPKPVDDTTQDGHLKAEYAGSSPWGKPFNVALGYGISVYNDNVGCGSVGGGFRGPGLSDGNCLTFQNPWVAPAGNAGNSPAWNRYSLWPDNQAQSVTATAGVGLPLSSRYMGTFQYSWMTQDDTFLASTINPLAVLATLPRSNLDGDARTILSNNVLHTQITPDLDSKLRYRYYDYHSNQDPMTIANVYTNPDRNSTLTDETAWPLNFNKQNANAELVYRPWKWLDVGAIYEWERWQHNYPADGVNVVTDEPTSRAVTNENSGKAFFDAKWGWSTLRTSVRYGERRFDGDYVSPGAGMSDFMRTVDLQNRDSTVVKSSWDINVTNTVTFTPTGGYQLNDYPADGITTVGISSYESWNVGGDVAWTVTPMLALYVSYMHEDGARETFQRPNNSPPLSRQVYHTHDLDDVFIVGGKYTMIPDKLFLNATYTYSRGTSKWASTCGAGGCDPNPVPTYPDTHNTNQRVDAWVKYVFDESVLKAAGFTGKPFVKAHVVWEKNENDSWQNIDQQLGWALPGADSTLQRAIFLGMSDPNYDVVVGMVSLGLKW
jgi:MtrB/PioB family decaheme-associated outer membrane protein